MADGHSIAKLAGAVAACEAAGGIGAFLSREGLQEWYPELQKPSFNPPGWVFGPTWALLYALMGTSLWLAEERGEDGAAKRTSRVFFGAQLLLNVLWTYVFFGRRAPGWAFVEVLVLLAAIASYRRVLREGLQDGGAAARTVSAVDRLRVGVDLLRLAPESLGVVGDLDRLSLRGLLGNSGFSPRSYCPDILGRCSPQFGPLRNGCPTRSCAFAKSRLRGPLLCSKLHSLELCVPPKNGAVCAPAGRLA